MDDQSLDALAAHTAALNTLTAELHSAGRRRRLLTIVGVAVLVVLVAGFLRTSTIIVDQAKLNGRVTACGLSGALGNDSKKCAEVKAAFARDGIPLTPNVAAQSDPTRNPAVAVILCNQNAVAGLPPPAGVTCPAPKEGT